MRIIVGLSLLLCALQVQAQRLMLEIPAQPLGSALEQLAAQAAVQLLYPSAAIEGRSSPPLAGEYTFDAALQALLAGTGLRFRRGAGATVVIEAANDERVIGAVRVAGEGAGPRRGINGSTDTLATENSGSYAPRGAGVGSPYPQALKDTPRAVNVIGLPQLRDQNINELADALRRLPSVAAEGYRTESLSVSLRGRPLEFYQLDGGPVRPFLGQRVFGELSAYDRVELLHGADGLGNAFASPAGTLNLVRKRPLDHRQVVVEGAAGSWDHARGLLDANAAPVWDGRLRGRMVFSGTDRNHFYEPGRLDRRSVYAVTEADLSPSTLLRVGGQIVNQHGSPWETGGQPRFEDGEPVPLPRSASFVPSWNREDLRQRNLFAAVEQHFGQRWNARLSLERHRERRLATVTELFGAVNRETGDGLLAVSVLNAEENEYLLADLRVNGRFMLWDREQIVSFGLSHAGHDLRERYPGFLDFYSTLAFVNLADDPELYPQPGYGFDGLEDVVNRRNRHNHGSVALTLAPLDPLRVIAAWRWGEWSTYMRVDPQGDIRDLAPRRRTRTHGLSYLGATWALNGQWNLYASWADAFILNDELLTPAGDNPEPTVGDNVEAGLKYAAADGAVQARLTLYRSERSNFPRYLPPDEDENGLVTVYCCYDSATDDRDRIQGVEAELIGAPLPHWQLSAAYTHVDLRYRYAEPPVDLPGIDDTRGASIDFFTPRHALRLWAVWSADPYAGSGIRAGAGVRAQSRSIMPLIESQGDLTFPGGPQRQDAYTVVDAMLGWRFHMNWDAAVHARNLFDEKYYEAVRGGQTGVFWGEPRSLALTLRGTFR